MTDGIRSPPRYQGAPTPGRSPDSAGTLNAVCSVSDSSAVRASMAPPGDIYLTDGTRAPRPAFSGRVARGWGGPATGEGRARAESRPAPRSHPGVGLAAHRRLPGRRPRPVLSPRQRTRPAAGRPGGGGEGGLPALPGAAAVRGACRGHAGALRHLGRDVRGRPGTAPAVAHRLR